MNVFIRAKLRIFSFGERWNVLFNSAIASLNRTFHLSPHENILTTALINIHYLYTIPCYSGPQFLPQSHLCPWHAVSGRFWVLGKTSYHGPPRHAVSNTYVIREFKQATFLSTRTSAGNKLRRYRWRVMASAVLVWNQQRQSFSFRVCDFKRERLTPSFGIYNDAVYFRLTSVLTKTSLA